MPNIIFVYILVAFSGLLSKSCPNLEILITRSNLRLPPSSKTNKLKSFNARNWVITLPFSPVAWGLSLIASLTSLGVNSKPNSILYFTFCGTFVNLYIPFFTKSKNKLYKFALFITFPSYFENASKKSKFLFGFLIVVLIENILYPILAPLVPIISS